MESAVIGIVMGSDSDWRVMKEASKLLESFGVPHLSTIVSAHRTPERLYDFAASAHEKGLEVIIAGAGGAAHLPGMIAAISPLPVIGVPVKSSNSIDGWDSVLSILQMPGGVPVATVALDGAKNAALLAIQILSVARPELRTAMLKYKKELKDGVLAKLDNFPPQA